MQDNNIRLKTQGALLDRSVQMNLQKYGEQLKSQLEEISKMLGKKKKQVKEEQTLSSAFKKQSADNNTFKKMNKAVVTELDESMVRLGRNKERENKRNLIYGTESHKEIEGEMERKEEELKQTHKMDKVKSPYSETVSTSSSHKQAKEKGKYKEGMSLSDFSLGKKLGQGKFGEVFVAKHRRSGFICALKRIYRSCLDQKMIIQLAREIKIQYFLNQPNIVKLYTFFSDTKAIYLIQELCSSGQLYTLLKKQRRISQQLTRIVIQQICRALDYMHECQIIHRDIKPQNIIYHNGLVKICDFGWSISSKAMRETFCGTPLYISPELLKKKCYNNKIDVWGIGVLTYELLFGRVPFDIVSQRDFIKIIEDELRFSKAATISQEAKDFISICLSKDPRDRYTVPELLEHPFMAQMDKPSLAELY